MPQTANQENFLHELGLQDLSADKQIELLDSMTRVLLKKITLKVYKKLSAKDLKDFERVKKTKDADKIHDFLSQRIKNYDQMVKKIVAEFKNDIKDDLKHL